MLNRGDIHLLALEFRQKGYSYSQIATKLGIAKSTLSNWLSKYSWSAKIRTQNSKKRQEHVAASIHTMNRARLIKWGIKQENFKIQAKKEFDELAKDPLFLVGVSLYWGEGAKHTRGKVGVINSDPRVLEIIMQFYLKVLKIPKEKIRAELFIYPDHLHKDIHTFWATTLQLSKQQFIKTQLLTSRASLTTRRVPYGMCNVYFSSTEFSIKIHEWINILSEKISESSSVG